MMNPSPESITSEYGTPVYIHRQELVERANRDLRDLLPDPCRLYFSLKANPNHHIGAILHRGGCHAEISSTGELSSAIRAGFDVADALYTGPGKTVDEIATALSAGVRTFSCESLADLHRVAKAADAADIVARCLLRVNGPAAHGNSAMRMTGTATQFGIDIATTTLTAADLDIDGVDVVGLHFFPVSNVLDETVLINEIVASVGHAREFAQRLGITVQLLDLGGGFAAPYGRDGVRPTYPNLRAAVADALDTSFPGWRGGAPVVAFESGRYLTCDSGTLVARVTEIKSSGGREFVITDTGIHHVGGLSGIGRVPPISATIVGSDTGGAESGEAAVVGPLCTPADVLNHRSDLAGARPGDLVTIPNVGAYGISASLMGFLSRPAPAEIVTCGDRVVAASVLETTRRDLP
ncbi:hypothetical protein ACTWPB_14335 [Nocardia sp. IBHARD005]|uniref:hypothetical protein n=1 Tax=Nocardia sp. IBHARD005 TaxID=3457765 RepID=UPI00405898D4